MTNMIDFEGQPTGGTRPLIDTLVFGGAWEKSSNGKVNLTYAFQSGTDPFTFENGEPVSGLTRGESWNSTEKLAFAKAFAAWATFANITFTQKSNSDGADLWYWKGGNSDFEDNVLAWHHLPGGAYSPPAYGVFNSDGYSWKSASLQPGGHAFLIIMHELGHGLGLAHPHRDEPGEESFPGVGANSSALGTYGLNQGVFTIMSYNDGWRSKFPNHTNINYGNSLTPMALDIAALQEIYGTKAHKTGSDTYVLPKANVAGIGWSCIWDTGGIDKISAGSSSTSATIDLRAAPLVGANAGGYVSWHAGIVGGFTIANGVVIENATGGSGNDRLNGNGVANILSGGNGKDTIYGFEGDDKIIGGLGDDTMWGGTGVDTAYFTTSKYGIIARLESNSVRGLGNDRVYGIENIVSGQGNDSLWGNILANRLESGRGNDTLDGRGGADRMLGGLGNDTYYVNNAGDTIVEYAGQGYDRIFSTVTVTTAMSGANVEEIRLTGALSVNITGNGLGNRLVGNAGANTIDGGLGSDIITGGAGADNFRFSSLLGTGNVDTLADFNVADDTIQLSQAIFTGLGFGAVDAAAFVIGTAATEADDRIVFDDQTGALYYDPDGNGAGEAIRFATLSLTGLVGTLSEADFLVI
jgi:serralysin